MAPRLDLEKFLPLSLPFFFLVEKPSDKRSDYLESLFCRRDSSHTAAPSIYSRGSPGIGCYTPTSRPTCVRVNDAPPTLKYAPRWTKIRGRFSGLIHWSPLPTLLLFSATSKNCPFLFFSKVLRVSF